jgi:hypothetical protein
MGIRAEKLKIFILSGELHKHSFGETKDFSQNNRDYFEMRARFIQAGER